MVYNEVHKRLFWVLRYNFLMTKWRGVQSSLSKWRGVDVLAWSRRLFMVLRYNLRITKWRGVDVLAWSRRLRRVSVVRRANSSSKIRL